MALTVRNTAAHEGTPRASVLGVAPSADVGCHCFESSRTHAASGRTPLTRRAGALQQQPGREDLVATPTTARARDVSAHAVSRCWRRRGRCSEGFRVNDASNDRCESRRPRALLVNVELLLSFFVSWFMGPPRAFAYCNPLPAALYLSLIHI